MKTKNLFFTGISMLAATTAMAGPLSGSDRLKTAMDLQAEGKVEQAYVSALGSIVALRNQLKTGEVLARIDTSITAIQDEKVVGKLKTRDEYGGGISALWGLITGGARLAKVSNHDLTQILVQNPEEVARFSGRARTELEKLRSKLIAHVNENANDIIAMKGLSVVYLQSAMKLMESGTRVNLDEMKTVIETATEMSFNGEQTVTTCVTTQYASWRKKDRSDMSAEFNLFGLLSANYAEGHQRDERQFAYSDKVCQSSTNEISVKPTDSPIWKIDLSRLDRVVQDWARATILKRAISKAEDEVFPTFDSPYYR